MVGVDETAQLRARPDAELGERIAQVRVHGVWRQEKALRHLAIRSPASHEMGDLELAVSEAVNPRLRAWLAHHAS
jgi:hypothetical protein